MIKWTAILYRSGLRNVSLLAVFIALPAVSLIFLILNKLSEPTYNSKSISHYMYMAFEYKKDSEENSQAAGHRYWNAVEAIGKMGPEGIHWLKKKLRSQMGSTPGFSQEIYARLPAIVRNQLLIPSWIGPITSRPEYRMLRDLDAFDEDLVMELLSDATTRLDVTHDLLWILHEKQNLEPLGINSLPGTNSYPRIYQMLENNLTSAISYEKLHSAFLCVFFERERASEARAILIENVKDPGSIFWESALNYIDMLGPKAMDAVPVLEALLEQELPVRSQKKIKSVIYRKTGRSYILNTDNMQNDAPGL
jgi:hypothetical protein